MGAEDWGHWDLDDAEWLDHEDVPFECPCKWCGKPITMSPTDKGWKPMSGGRLHVCEERKRSQQRKTLSLLPDLELQPPCQFCGTTMKFIVSRHDDDSWGADYYLTCPSCGANGPRISFGHPDYDKIKKLARS